MVDSLMVACCNAQAGQTDDSDLALAQGQEALNELRDMGWDEAVRYTYWKGLEYRIDWNFRFIESYRFFR